MARSVPAEATSRLRVLLVEDQEDDRFLLKFAIRRCGAAIGVAEVSNGQEALDYLDGKDRYADRAHFPFPNFMLLDLSMPGLHGFEVLERVRKRHAAMPVVVWSSSDNDKDVSKAYALGARAYHVKPSDSVALDGFCDALVIFCSSAKLPRTSP